MDYGEVEGGDFIIKDSSEWTRDQAYAISEIRVTHNQYGKNISFKLFDKVKANENLGRVHGIYEEDNNQASKIIIEDVTPKKQ